MAYNVLESVLERLDREMSTAAKWAVAARPAAWKNRPDSDRVAFFEKEALIRAVISQGCMDWAQGGVWPVMNPDDAVYVWERVWRAHEFGQWLLKSGFDAPQKPANELMAWLLVDAWAKIFWYEWKEDLFGG